MLKRMENKQEMKDVFSYVTTLAIVGVNFIGLNEILTSLVLLATLIYWVQKNWGLYKRNKR